MNENTVVNSNPEKIKEFLKSKNFLRPLIAVSIGSTAGLLYYLFVGCSSGSCAITSNPYMSTIWGGLLGLFIVNSPCSRGKC